MEHHYRTLGIRAGSSLREVKRAYRRLAMKHHPDHGGDTETMKKINVAYEAIVGATPQPVNRTPRQPTRRPDVGSWFDLFADVRARINRIRNAERRDTVVGL